MASISTSAMDLLGRISHEMHLMKPLLPTYIHLLASAIFPIYTAAHASLARPSSAAPAKKQDRSDINDLQDEEISPTLETLTASDALLFPVLAGATLASLYFILKWLQDPALLNYYLGLYFGIVGLWFTIKFVSDGLTTIRSFVLPNQYSYDGKVWKLATGDRRFAVVGDKRDEQDRTSPLPGRLSIFFQRRNSMIWALREIIYTRFRLKCSVWKLINVTTIIDTSDLAALIIAAPLGYYHTFIGKPWFLTNILGFSFCYGSLQVTTPGTSSTGSLLLAALFIYDIYFVFFTPMMVTVATKLDVPIKLLFPRPDGCIKPIGAEQGSQAMEEYLQCLAKKRTMAMLGLGDIVIPGMMLAFALRFDLYLYYHRQSATKTVSSDPKEEKISDKPTYLPATGSWGERFWTNTALFAPELKAKQFPKVYFTASTVGYILGMIATVVVMQVYQHAQPALLYLVPGVLGSLWSVALIKGDFKALWNYSEVPEESKSDEKKTQDETVGDKNDQKKVENARNGSTKVESKTTVSETQAKKDAAKKKIEIIAKENHVVYLALTMLTSTDSKQANPKQAQKQLPAASSVPNSASTDTSQDSTVSVTERDEATSTSITDTEDWSSDEVDEEDASSNDHEESQEGGNGSSSSDEEGGDDDVEETVEKSQRSSARIAARHVWSSGSISPETAAVRALKRHRKA